MHFVLVHGASHGAWCWFKLKPLLEAAGHRVSAVELATAGVDPQRLEDLRTLRDYTAPLLEFMAAPVGLGGLSLALAAEDFLAKVCAAVFLAAFMPDTVHHPSYVLEQYNASVPEGHWRDSQFASVGSPGNPLTSMAFGPQFLSLLYHLSPPEDFELGMMLKRPASFFLEKLATAQKFTEEKYGKVKRVYVLCKEDRGIPESFQCWMIENGGVDEVKVLEGSDHMPMLSMPKALCDCLVEITEKICMISIDIQSSIVFGHWMCFYPLCSE